MGKMAMKKDGKYQVKVTDIKPCVRKFVKKDVGEVCRHDITIEDKVGNTLVCEYINKSEVPLEFALGVYQWIKCLYPETNGAVIEPTEPPGDNYTPVTIQEDKEKPSTLGINDCNVKNISGCSITFATAYAKDLKVAEIERQPAGYKVTDQDLLDVAKWAAMLNDKMIDLINY